MVSDPSAKDNCSNEPNDNPQSVRPVQHLATVSAELDGGITSGAGPESSTDGELRADWIGFDQPHPATPHGDDWFDIEQAHWICHPASKKGERFVAFYRTTCQVPPDASRVTIGMAANFVGQLFVNGIEVFQAGRSAVTRKLPTPLYVAIISTSQRRNR